MEQARLVEQARPRGTGAALWNRRGLVEQARLVEQAKPCGTGAARRGSVRRSGKSAGEGTRDSAIHGDDGTRRARRGIREQECGRRGDVGGRHATLEEIARSVEVL